MGFGLGFGHLELVHVGGIKTGNVMVEVATDPFTAVLKCRYCS
jgi:hypothetical protein